MRDPFRAASVAKKHALYAAADELDKNPGQASMHAEIAAWLRARFLDSKLLAPEGVAAGCAVSTGALVSPEQTTDHADSRASPVADDMVVRAVTAWYGTPPDELDPEDETACADAMRELLSAALAGCTVVPTRAPDMQRERLDGVMQIWNVGGWSVTAIGDQVAIASGPDGYGGGMAFRLDQVRELCAALLAGFDHLAGSQVGDQ